MTDTQRVLQLFKDHANQEINHRMIVDGLRISEYTGRITDARVELNCTCGKDKTTCTAREHIINTRKGYYKFVTPVAPPVLPVEKKLDPEEQLEKMREQYREAKKNNDQRRMNMILRLVDNIKNADPSFEQLVQQTLG